MASPSYTKSPDDDRKHFSGHLRILVADDEPTVRQIVREFLEEDGHDVHAANDGQEALERFKSGTWDLIITDRVMPKLSGDGLARAVKKINPGIPILLLTAFADRSPDPAGRGSPFDMIIRKPFTRETLHAAISSCVMSRG